MQYNFFKNRLSKKYPHIPNTYITSLLDKLHLTKATTKEKMKICNNYLNDKCKIYNEYHPPHTQQGGTIEEFQKLFSAWGPIIMIHNQIEDFLSKMSTSPSFFEETDYFKNTPIMLYLIHFLKIYSYSYTHLKFPGFDLKFPGFEI